MKIMRIVAREPIVELNNDYELEIVDGIFRSPYHEFNDNASIDEIGETLYTLYEKNISKLVNPNITYEPLKVR